MKNGFILISTISIIAILSILTLFINSLTISNALTISNFNDSIEQRIKIINYERFVINSLQNNSNQLRNLQFAEGEINYLVSQKFPTLGVKFYDLNSCLNLNSIVKPFRSLLVKNEDNYIYFENLLDSVGIDKLNSEEFIHRLVDYIDSDQLPEPLGAEDLFYVSDESYNLTVDTFITDKSQIIDLKILNYDDLHKIYDQICAIPTTENKFNINSLSVDNFLLFKALFTEITLDEMQQIIINKPQYGYLNAKSLIDLNPYLDNKIDLEILIFKPEFLQISFKININNKDYYFFTVADLKNKNNQISIRTITK